jgi:RNA polymerase sigma-70 factor (ECF subfamily)
LTLEQQDRSLWDAGQIGEGVGLLAPSGGAYQLQAAIAACHDISPSAEKTDWTRIAVLYGKLAALSASPFVELNRAVAVAMADGPAVGLLLVDALDAAGDLEGYHLLAATQADLLRRLGRRAEAAEAYERALALAPTEAEQRYLAGRLAEVAPEKRS